MSESETVEPFSVTRHSLPDTLQTQKPLRVYVEYALYNYFAQLGEVEPSNIYELVLSEIETPLLQVILQKTGGNQSKAARLLGLSRGTLRKKLKQYNLE